MSILITGMEMPTEEEIGKCIIIRHDGEVGIVKNLADIGFVVCYPKNQMTMMAVPVQPHGRLIDADALREDWLENGENEYVYDTNAFLDSLDDAPTIIPADPAEEGE